VAGAQDLVNNALRNPLSQHTDQESDREKKKRQLSRQEREHPEAIGKRGRHD
jgi:hypothetical protein